MRAIRLPLGHSRLKLVLRSWPALVFVFGLALLDACDVRPSRIALAPVMVRATQPAGSLTPTSTRKAMPAPTATGTRPATPTATATALPPERSQPRYPDGVTNLDVLFASHLIDNRPKTTDEYRVILIGDSGTWAIYLPSSGSLAGRLNAAELQTCDSRAVRVYNMSFGGTSLVKDLVFIDKAVEYKPDLVIWFLTLDTFRPNVQLTGSNFLLYNRPYVQDLSKRFNLGLNTASLALDKQTADQAWAIVREVKEPAPHDSYPALSDDQKASIQFTRKLKPPQIQARDLPFNLFYTGLKILSGTEVLVVNEPIFIASGKNSNLRYNEYYPRWAYDQYRQIMLNQSQTQNWDYLDLWNAIPAREFTGTPLHRAPDGELQMFNFMAPIIQQYPCQ